MGGEKLRTTEVDGVPVYWLPGPGTLRANLWFRAGMADEPLPAHGWLHLLEHLALHGRHSIRTPVNGQVSLLHTAFDVEGEPDAVVAHLRDLCRWLSDPVFSDLDHERRVLRAESSRRGSSVVGSHLLWRYGARGPGLAGYDELGLYTAEPDGLRELAARAYAQGNAVLALSGPPPAGLELPLRPGPRMVPARSVQCDQPLPGGFAGQPAAIALSGTAVRSTAAGAMLRAFERGLQGGLRHKSGVGYSAWSSYEVVDADRAMLTVGMDVLPEAVRSAVSESIGVLRRMRDHGPDPVELRDDLDAQIRQFGTQPAHQWLPFLAARDALLGTPVTHSVDELAAETDAVTVTHVREAAMSVWRDLLVSVDPRAGGDPQLTWLSDPPAGDKPTDGRRFRPIHPEPKTALIVGASGVHRETADGRTSTPYDEVAGMISYGDGGRQLIRHDGYQVQVEPTFWRRGAQAVALLDSAIPAALHIRLPERPKDQIPRFKVRRIDTIRAWLDQPIVWVPFLVLVIIGLVLTVAPDEIASLAQRAIPIALAIAVITFVRGLRSKK
ncbi:hypothetical protein HPO96_18005 [Kribbella sandramycini]|uniref:Zn-dependent peptidase n=1 Tax=Kribbella sandramycini TaxID=60450 RepID=A0A7Y4L0M7_9ACTN|nr:hypothetical protein [Kribbella sandramycini]MBB6565879.1 hypothetical protein [Kribbella sandramycini]NOL42143.1 hypothetical protein [Kribbella sandramycini]